jgi:hypothetical protein
MDESSPRDRQPPSVRKADESPLLTVVVALLFLYLGFFAPFMPYDNDPALQKISIHAFNWMARIVGFGLLLVAALSYARVALAVPLNFVLALLAAAGCLGAGAVWMANGYSTGFLILIFGVLNAYAARGAWVVWRQP